jgi:hypothetical protein
MIGRWGLRRLERAYDDRVVDSGDVRLLVRLIPLDLPLVTAYGANAVDGKARPAGAALLLWGATLRADGERLASR